MCLFTVALNLTPGIHGEKSERELPGETKSGEGTHKVLDISQIEGIHGRGKVP